MAERPLPPNVTEAPDRHGKMRCRYRRSGVNGGYLPGEKWSSEWLTKLAEYSSQKKPEIIHIGPTKRIIARSMDALARELRSTVRWQRQAEDTRRVYGRIIDRLLERTSDAGKRFGDRLVADISVSGLEKMLGKMADKPGAAKKFRDVLIRMFSVAVKLGWRTDNPAKATDSIKQIGDGHHTWTEAEIIQYRAAYAYGTTARLVFELALNSAARRCNIATIERSQIRDGFIAISHAKGGEETLVGLMPEAKLALEAMPSAHIRFVIVTAYGKPFTVPGLGNRFKEWADKAGLPAGRTLHGLRKAQTRRLAEAGVTNAEGRAITGHKTDSMFNHYAQKANRKKLAGSAMAKLRDDLSNQEE